MSDRFWPLWVAGLQLIDSMSHLMKAIDADLLPTAYGAAERFWSYPILFILFDRRLAAATPADAAERVRLAARH